MSIETESHVRLRPPDVRRLCGEILDWKVDAILASGADVADLIIAVARMTGADDAAGEQTPPLEGKAAEVYDLLVNGEDFPGDEDA
jgi:hypothetical protein